MISATYHRRALGAPGDQFRPSAPKPKPPAPSRGPKDAISVFAPWATNVYGGLCVHPITGQVRDAATGGPADAYGALAPGTSVDGLPACPIQMPPAPPPPPTANNPIPTNIYDEATRFDDQPGYGVNPPPSPQPKKWIPWALGGVVAAIGAAIVVAVANR